MFEFAKAYTNQIDHQVSCYYVLQASFGLIFKKYFCFFQKTKAPKSFDLSAFVIF